MTGITGPVRVSEVVGEHVLWERAGTMYIHIKMKMRYVDNKNDISLMFCGEVLVRPFFFFFSLSQCLHYVPFLFAFALIDWLLTCLFLWVPPPVNPKGYFVT